MLGPPALPAPLLTKLVAIDAPGRIVGRESPGDDALDTNGAFALRALGAAGLAYDIEASTNLVDWIYLGTAPADTNGAVQFTDPSATNYSLRYYRVQSP